MALTLASWATPTGGGEAESSSGSEPENESGLEEPLVTGEKLASTDCGEASVATAAARFADSRELERSNGRRSGAGTALGALGNGPSAEISKGTLASRAIAGKRPQDRVPSPVPRSVGPPGPGPSSLTGLSKSGRLDPLSPSPSASSSGRVSTVARRTASCDTETGDGSTTGGTSSPGLEHSAVALEWTSGVEPPTKAEESSTNNFPSLSNAVITPLDTFSLNNAHAIHPHSSFHASPTATNIDPTYPLSHFPTFMDEESEAIAALAMLSNSPSILSPSLVSPALRVPAPYSPPPLLVGLGGPVTLARRVGSVTVGSPLSGLPPIMETAWEGEEGWRGVKRKHRDEDTTHADRESYGKRAAVYSVDEQSTNESPEPNYPLCAAPLPPSRDPAVIASLTPAATSALVAAEAAMATRWRSMGLKRKGREHGTNVEAALKGAERMAAPAESWDESDAEAEDGIVRVEYGMTLEEAGGGEEGENERRKRMKVLEESILSLFHAERESLFQSQSTVDTRLSHCRLAIKVARSKIEQARRNRRALDEAAECARALRKRISEVERAMSQVRSWRDGMVRGVEVVGDEEEEEGRVVNGVNGVEATSSTSGISTIADSTAHVDAESDLTGALLAADDRAIDAAVNLTEAEEKAVLRLTRFQRFLRACTGWSAEELDGAVEALGKELGSVGGGSREVGSGVNGGKKGRRS
ncbi:hypothetical protein HDU96_001989 [Phlyctochytrium bullatum]|nr:hypothetical protein HDU96_001989 [Phlyctochytrium bullatum]